MKTCRNCAIFNCVPYQEIRTLWNKQKITEEERTKKFQDAAKDCTNIVEICPEQE